MKKKMSGRSSAVENERKKRSEGDSITEVLCLEDVEDEEDTLESNFTTTSTTTAATTTSLLLKEQQQTPPMEIVYELVTVSPDEEQEKRTHLTYVVLMMLLENDFPSRFYQNIANIQAENKVFPEISSELRTLAEKMYLDHSADDEKVSKSWSVQIRGLKEELLEQRNCRRQDP